MSFPNSHLDLFQEGTPALLYLATTMPDGSPQVTPVWFNTDGPYILINTNEGRIKERNMQVRPRVAMVIQDPNDPYRYIQIRGEVIARIHAGADAHINQLSLKYRGEPWEAQAGQRRVIFKIQPLHFDAH